MSYSVLDGMPGQDFFRRRRAHSAWKHEILQKYMRVWVYKLASAFNDLAFVDAFAGEGIYEDGSEGSPLIAVRWNDEQVLARSGKRLIVHACESHPESFARLAVALRPWMERTPPLAILYPQPFEQVLAGIAARTRHAPTLAFLDPYGMRHLSVDRLQPLLDADRAPTEILMRVDHGLLARFAGWHASRPDRERDLRWQRTAETYRTILASLNVNPGDADRGRRGQLGRAFAQYLEAFEQRFTWVQIIPIRDAYDAAPKYYLVHCTDSPHGAAKINDVFSTTEDELFEETELTRAGDQGLLFAPQREPRVRAIDAARYVAALLLQHPEGLSFVEVCAALAVRFGPDLREKHHRAAVRLLMDQGVVEPRADRIDSDTWLRRAPARAEEEVL